MTSRAIRAATRVPTRAAPIAPLECVLCCEPCFAEDYCESLGSFVCELCVEHHLEAANTPRSEVGMVGASL